MPPGTDAGRAVAKKPATPKSPAPMGVLNVSHKPQMSSSEEVEVKAGEIHIDERGNIISSQIETPFSPPGPQAPVIQTAQMPLAGPQAPVLPAKKDDGTIPGPHTLLDPTSHQPAINPPFTADTAPEWDGRNESMSNDPLSDSPKTDEPFGLGKSVNPTQAVDSARSAVDSALTSAPFDPAGHPVVGLGTQPLSRPLHQTPQNPPPPVPPPLIPTPTKNNKQ